MNMSKLARSSASVPALAAHEGLRGRSVHSVRVAAVKERLIAANGGYEIVHESRGLELGVYVLVAPEPDRQQTNDGDEVYVVLEGTGVLEVEGEPVPIAEGAAVYVEAGAERRFTVYEQLSVLVICDRREDG
jgi:mannose-6-phosphate isomerase-like protein (cupin superfamily)